MEQTQHRADYFLPGLAIGTLLGGAIGGLAALWLAPQSGKQLQTLMHKQGKTLKHQADKATSHVVEQIEDTVAQTAEQVQTLRHDGEQFLNDRVEMINQAALSAKKSVFK
ncbi:MAG: YtxH domain-containing protein [Caldilineaceae bacterium]|jgi:gas vesicle protein